PRRSSTSALAGCLNRPHERPPPVIWAGTIYDANRMRPRASVANALNADEWRDGTRAARFLWTRPATSTWRRCEMKPIPIVPGQDPMKPGDEVPAGTPGSGENVCRRCGGTGAVDGNACPDCDGTGTVITNVGDA